MLEESLGTRKKRRTGRLQGDGVFGIREGGNGEWDAEALLASPEGDAKSASDGASKG